MGGDEMLPEQPDPQGEPAPDGAAPGQSGGTDDVYEMLFPGGGFDINGTIADQAEAAQIFDEIGQVLEAHGFDLVEEEGPWDPEDFTETDE